MEINPNLLRSVGGTILWKNTNPTASTFASQNIALNSSNYDYYEIIVNWSADVNRTQSSGKVLKGSGTVFNFVSTHSWYRTINYVSDTQLTVNNCTEAVIYPTSTSTNNRWFIPLYVIGYKTDIL